MKVDRIQNTKYSIDIEITGAVRLGACIWAGCNSGRVLFIKTTWHEL